MSRLKVTLKDFLYHFGYTNHPTEVGETAFFDYSKHEKEDLASYNKFKSSNTNEIENIGVPNRYNKALIKDESMPIKLACLVIGFVLISFSMSGGLTPFGLAFSLVILGAIQAYLTSNI